MLNLILLTIILFMTNFSPLLCVDFINVIVFIKIVHFNNSDVINLRKGGWGVGLTKTARN